VDTDLDARAWLPVPDGFETGAAGIARLGDDLLVGCQAGGVVRYGADLRPVTTLPTAGARNLHSIFYRPEEHALYVVSAHNDTLFRYRLDDAGTKVISGEEIYCADPERRGQDRYHLNSVTEWRGALYVTMFGPANGPTHLHRRHGSVVRVDDGETVAKDLYHPHSLYVHDGDLFVVESQARTLRRIGGREPCEWAIARGYPRGVVAADETHLWVGVSALRRESNSLGTPNVITSTEPTDFMTRLVEIDLTTGATGREIDLSLLAAEVFELRALPHPERFVADPMQGLAQRIESLEETFRNQRAARQALEAGKLDRPAQRAKQFALRMRARLRAR
jgi:hypothetical protein